MRRVTLAMAGLGIVLLAFAGCATKAQEGALVGGGIGAGAGALIGSTTGNPGGGAIIGGAIGAGTGAIIGNQTDQQNKQH